jgi:hypothetical protein
VSQVLEAEIRDIFANFPEFVQEILGDKFPCEKPLMLRDKERPLNGRLDLTYDCGDRLLLIELKARKARLEDFGQAARYCECLAKMIARSELPRYVVIDPFVLATELPKRSEVSCGKEGCPRWSGCHGIVRGISYDVGEVLRKFGHKEILSSKAHRIRPRNIGAYKFYFNKLLKYLLDEGPRRDDELAEALVFHGHVRRRGSRLRTYLKEAEVFELVERDPEGRVVLTDKGREYALATDVPNPETINRQQAAILRECIVDNPLGNPTIFGICSFVEALYELSKNTYPVRSDEFVSYFTRKVGNVHTWRNETTRRYQVRFFGKYCEQLGLAKKIGDNYYLTPSGAKLVLHLQLGKVKEMI